ncbi:bestrophin-like domain [Streptomyces sp. 4N509B]|uniref:bestrophin-like domain n=1 Tax=Streptomyces sp. 4N509B TaxID=3457413 RepID=UPI003FD27768
MSQWLALIAVIVATCAVVILIAVLRQRRAGDDDDPSETPDVIEYMTMMLGVVYAMVVGLAIAGVWEERSAAEEWVQREALALYEVSQRAEVLPPEARDDVQGRIDDYLGHATAAEWTHMVDHGELTDRGTALLGELRDTVTSREPETVREVESYQAMVDKVAAAEEARIARGESAGPTMPRLVWIGLVTGAAVVIGMVFALQIQRSSRELVLAGLFSGLIAFLLYLIWYFDDPYARSLDGAVEAFTGLFPQLVAGSGPG